MKPKEFDELIRQKFDQNDFPYESRNWDKLADQLDGRTKKRSMMIWWMMPLASIAASVAMAVGVTFFFQQSQKGLSPANTAFTQHNNIKNPLSVQNESGNALVASTQQYPSVTAFGRAGLHETKNNSPIFTGKKSTEEKFAISFENAVGFSAPTHARSFVFNGQLIPGKDKKIVEPNEGYNTFKPEEEEYKKPTKNSITIAGGVNHGNENSGYMLGANIRHMINDKLFVESDVAFANSSNSQTTEVLAPATAGSSGARHAASAGRNTATESSRPLNTESPVENVENENQSYTLYYAQVTPGLGYKVMNNMSLGVGPDFQQMLGDNRPAPSTVDRNNIAVAPIFDVGFVGKTEYALTKKVKAGVSYRKGINNLLTPMDKYIDRDYLQFQLKCTVFNK
jgi:hypothetical protein